MKGKPMLRLIPLFGLIFLSAVYAGTQTDPTLTITTNAAHPVTYTRSQLLARQDLDTLTVAGNPAFPGKSTNYKAIKLCNLLTGISADQNGKFEFVGADGYVTIIPANSIMDCSGKHNVAYLAIEPNQPWPPLPHGSGTAGPFDLIWKSATPVRPQYWPWQVVEIRMAQNTNELTAPATTDSHVQAGFNTFKQYCSVCHAINGMGNSIMGPYLNLPMSPVEYYKNDTLLRRFIRNPQDIRKLEKDRMPGVGNALSATEMDNLVAYMRYMSQHRN